MAGSPREVGAKSTLEQLIKQLYPLSKAEVVRNLPHKDGYQVVIKPLPFGRDLTGFLLFHEIDLNKEVEPFAEAYRGFGLVRSADNFVTNNGRGTGFEGFYLGGANDGQEIIKAIAQQGADEIAHLHRLNPHSWKTIWKEVQAALNGQRVTQRALDTLNRMFMDALMTGRRRLRQQNNSLAERFRENTKAMVKAEPRLYFFFDPAERQIYSGYYQALKRRPIPGLNVIRYQGDPRQLLQGDSVLLEGWELMSQLGQMGHMAVRAAEKFGYLRYGPSEMAEAIKASIHR